MFIVGLTGGIASGKSTVAKVFMDLGAHVIDADRIVHDLLMPDQPAWHEVLDHFGPEILFPDKTIDRRKLGGIVFGNLDERTWLNRCLHPKVFTAYMTQVRHLCDRTPDCIVIFDAALLIETGYYEKMDKNIVVYAREDQQITRMTARDNFSNQQALARIQSQMSLDEKCRFADHIIDNSGSREYMERQTKELFSLLKQEARQS